MIIDLLNKLQVLIIREHEFSSVDILVNRFIPLIPFNAIQSLFNHVLFCNPLIPFRPA